MPTVRQEPPGLKIHKMSEIGCKYHFQAQCLLRNLSPAWFYKTANNYPDTNFLYLFAKSPIGMKHKQNFQHICKLVQCGIFKCYSDFLFFVFCGLPQATGQNTQTKASATFHAQMLRTHILCSNWPLFGQHNFCPKDRFSYRSGIQKFPFNGDYQFLETPLPGKTHMLFYGLKYSPKSKP